MVPLHRARLATPAPLALGIWLTACGGGRASLDTTDRRPADYDRQRPTDAGTSSAPRARAEGAEATAISHEVQDTAPRHASACIEFEPPAPETELEALQVEFACGWHSASTDERTGFLEGGSRCEPSSGINTFALRAVGSDASRYSALARCGYVRYDDGSFVGERIEVEVRDGKWCHEAALERLDLEDRLLLTDVAFTLEPKDGARERRLSVRFATRNGWTNAVPAERNLCAYVAHREPAAACGEVDPVEDCVCPCGDAWQDFFLAMELQLARD